MPTIIKNGRNYSGTSVSLTQAEYDALPEVTKMNGTTYFITDSEVVLNAEDVALDEGNLNDLAGSVATIETSPATANHEVGEYILWNGVVYIVTSAIATGENLVINSNISARTIGSELTALNKGLTHYDMTPWMTIVNGIRYASEGSHVFIWFNIAVSLTTTFTTVATLPTGRRPSFDEYFRVAGSNGSGNVTVLVSNNGQIQAKVDSGTGSAINGFICIA